MRVGQVCMGHARARSEDMRLNHNAHGADCAAARSAPLAGFPVRRCLIKVRLGRHVAMRVRVRASS
eukprot:7382120-Prymnesium_polylepis.2